MPHGCDRLKSKYHFLDFIWEHYCPVVDCGIDIGPIGEGGSEYCTGNEAIDNKILECYQAKAKKEFDISSKELVSQGEYKSVEDIPYFIAVPPGVLDSLAEQCHNKFK